MVGVYGWGKRGWEKAAGENIKKGQEKRRKLHENLCQSHFVENEQESVP